VRAPALVDQLAVSIVQEEEAIQVIPRRRPVEAADRGRLRIETNSTGIAGR
jgi:hypothetical protein